MKVLTFGEVMLRLKTPEHLKILQADTFEANYGGAEANVAVSLATLGDDVSYVTKVPVQLTVQRFSLKPISFCKKNRMRKR